jgi:hypothetical protein
MSSTQYCPECALPVPSNDQRRSDLICRHCGAELPGNDKADWVNVARVANLAEAGFLVDELSGEGVSARIYQSEDFNALTDRWSVSYLIQSSATEAQTVAARIRQHLADADARRGEFDETHSDDSASLADPGFWRPVAVVVLAGMASFALGQRFGHERGESRQAPPPNSLAGAVAAIGRPLFTEQGPGLPRHRLMYQWHDRSWLLDTDANDDGIYESHQRFQATGAGW